MTCTSKTSSSPQGCPNIYGCIPGVCPDFTIRRHDTKPPFRVKMDTCDGPMDLTGLILEATMWAKGKFKKTLDINDTYFSLADNIGFHQIMVGDIIFVDRPRSIEKMLVTGFDEENFLILVERGYHGTPIQKWVKGTPLRIMKFINAQSQTEMIYEDILEIDGTTTENVLTDSFFIYEWNQNDTCLSGCYYLEFKLIKLIESEVPEEILDLDGDGDDDIVRSPSEITWSPSEIVLPEVIPYPSLISGTEISPSFISTSQCELAEEIDWIRRFPISEEGFIIQITNSPTQE